MSFTDNWSGKVIPAQLSFLTIYNPTLGKTDETTSDQIVLWYSRKERAKRSRRGRDETNKQRAHEENEKLRQVGLAQGVVEFARTFSDGEAVDSVETEKNRIVLTEIEKNWWILASIDLTQLLVPPMSPSDWNQTTESGPSIEYSSREVSPPALLLQQIRSANSVFLLHHAHSLSFLWNRQPRVKFCEILDSFWSAFCRSWDVLLHGNPAVEIFNGIKLAAGGELGVGVGEEDWGSGEREVLEALIRNTEGLVDLVVSRFGDAIPEVSEVDKPDEAISRGAKTGESHEPWIGNGQTPGSADGVIFSGLGSLSRRSLRGLTNWTQWIFTHGEEAYGIRNNPKSGRAKRIRKSPAYRDENDERTFTDNDAVTKGEDGPKVIEAVANENETSKSDPTFKVPSPIVLPNIQASDKQDTESHRDDAVNQPTSAYHFSDSFPKSPQVLKYLSLGYATSWASFGRSETPPRSEFSSEVHEWDGNEGKSESSILETASNSSKRLPFSGHFLIGLRGDLEPQLKSPSHDGDQPGDDGLERRWDDASPLLRTIQVEVVSKAVEDLFASDSEFSDRPTISSSLRRRGITLQRVQVIVYVLRPFIFTFLFEPNTFSLTIASFYRDLHQHLVPLHRSLLASTSPINAAARHRAAIQSHIPTVREQGKSYSSAILDLIYDPASFTVLSSIPNIPLPGTLSSEGLDTRIQNLSGVSAWTRLEALAVHSQILSTYAETRRAEDELERTGKTRHGWWIVWMRLPAASTASGERHKFREAFLIRRSSDSVAPRNTGSLGKWTGRDIITEVAGGWASAWRPTKLSEGIGVDARRYVESLLSLDR